MEQDGGSNATEIVLSQPGDAIDFVSRSWRRRSWRFPCLSHALTTPLPVPHSSTLNTDEAITVAHRL